MRHVVVATDLSEASMPAAKEAAIAAMGGARVTLLLVLNVDAYLPSSRAGSPANTRARAEMQSESLEQLRTFRDTHVRVDGFDDPSGIELAVHDHGDAAEGIAQYAKQHDAGLIIVGTAGRTGLRRMLVGSVAEKVVRLAHCSVLVARV